MPKLQPPRMTYAQPGPIDTVSVSIPDTSAAASEQRTRLTYVIIQYTSR